MENKRVRKYLLECENCKKRKTRITYRKEFDDQLLCDSCYKILIKHPVNTIPDKGEVFYDEQGRMVCHICGRAYDKLTQHIKQIHNIGPVEYREMFGLNRTFKLTSERYKQKCRENINEQKISMLRHFEKGSNTLEGGTTPNNASKKRRVQYVKNRKGMKYGE